ncbi:TetR/AcrR family transcriptional regulator [Lentzea sp. CA-135723]|uniref:TetR/AcrR family transcriptional regulator n=1 Tax=Lentzea sp. CA-135723 TaxID=3239950 RepID=UPI003D8B6DA1
MNERIPLLDDAVLAAAAKVIAEHGWHEFTLERVAQAAGISRVTLYRKGATRELLIEALVVGAAQAWQAGLWPALTGPGTAAERLRAALRASCVVVEQHLSLLAGLSNAPDPVFHLDDGDTRNVYVAPFERLLHDGIADGSLRATLDPAETALLLFNIVPRTYIHLRGAHHWPPDRTADALLDLLMPGVLPARP